MLNAPVALSPAVTCLPCALHQHSPHLGFCQASLDTSPFRLMGMQKAAAHTLQAMSAALLPWCVLLILLAGFSLHCCNLQPARMHSHNRETAG